MCLGEREEERADVYVVLFFSFRVSMHFNVYILEPGFIKIIERWRWL